LVENRQKVGVFVDLALERAVGTRLLFVASGVARRIVAFIARVLGSDGVPDVAALMANRQLLFAGVADRRNLDARSDAVDVLPGDAVANVR
jgi:hypothetical protein